MTHLTAKLTTLVACLIIISFIVIGTLVPTMQEKGNTIDTEISETNIEEQ